MDREYLIKKWLNDDLTPAEREVFEKLNDYELHKKILEGAQHFKASKLKEPASIDTFYDRVQTHGVSKKPKKLRTSLVFRIAASIAILFGIATFFWINQDTTVQTLASNKTSITLPDNSHVGLNVASKIVFNKRNWAKNRELQLTGEAFFEVAKGATFDVITDGGVVQVLGTKFNVKSRKHYFEVQCFEGVVRVKVGETKKKLHPGDSYRLIAGKQESTTITRATPEWMDNITTFKSVPFAMVISEFERQYNVVISLDNIDTNRLFTGGFGHDNLNDALKAITSPLDISYHIDGKNHITMFYNHSKE